MQKLAHYCIDQPIFAAVVSIIITILGGIAYLGLPVTQYPDIVPPTIQLRASYAGASADVVSETVATPIEQELNGVDDMLYVQSQATGDGNLLMTVTFALGTDLDIAQVLVQNRLAIAEPRLPEEVRQAGVTVRQSVPDLLMVVHMISPGGTRDALFLSNFATLQIRDVLARIPGIGDVRVAGDQDYAMRVWLDPDRIASLNLTAGDVVDALRAQNVQVAAGVLDQPPAPGDSAFQLNVQTLGRLVDERQFGDIVVRTDADGRTTRIRDVARVELGARSYSRIGFLNDANVVPLQIYQRPGSNALEAANQIEALMETLKADFPADVDYRIIVNPTDFIAESVAAVYDTMLEACILVVFVVILFLQSWRASIIPILAIPVSLIGTFAVMAALGFSINNLTLFGLVLAIGIVVDDAIVVVENAERHLREGKSPREAAHLTVDEVATALVAIALVLCAVFIPAAFIAGIPGQFFRQFAVTIVATTAISALVSLTLSPALCALLLRHRGADHHPSRFVPHHVVRAFFSRFNAGFDRLADGYGRLTRRLIRVAAIMLAVYGGLIGLTGWQFVQAPTGFIPQQDEGRLLTVIELPPGASLARTNAVSRQVSDRLRATDGVQHVAGFAGYDATTQSEASNLATLFTILEPYAEREVSGRTVDVIQAELRTKLGDVQEAQVRVLSPPPVRGLGRSGGFTLMVEDRQGRGLEALGEATRRLVAEARRVPGLTNVSTPFDTGTPSVYADIDRVKAEMLGVPAERVFETLEVYLGSRYVNDFNYLGRTYRVTAQAEMDQRRDVEDIADLKTRNDRGQMVPLGSVATFEDRTGPYRVPRYNLYPAAEVQGQALPGFSTSLALAEMERLAERVLPSGFDVEWTEVALQERLAGDTGIIVFAASVVFVFLLLAAFYESWLLPLAVILIVPMCLLAGLMGLTIREMDVNILAQIGFVVLVGLAAKNAILIVEFAKQAEEQGMSRAEAAIAAARTRLRPILMTSMAFILGVLPLVLAAGAGAEMRQSLGTTVFAGMIGVTLFGLLFTPVFYTVCRSLAREPKADSALPVPAE